VCQCVCIICMCVWIQWQLVYIQRLFQCTVDPLFDWQADEGQDVHIGRQFTSTQCDAETTSLCASWTVRLQQCYSPHHQLPVLLVSQSQEDWRFLEKCKFTFSWFIITRFRSLVFVAVFIASILDTLLSCTLLKLRQYGTTEIYFFFVAWRCAPVLL